MSKKFKNVNDFAVEISKKEGKKKQVSIANIKEVLKISNELLDGYFYKLIKNEDKENKPKIIENVKIEEPIKIESEIKKAELELKEKCDCEPSFPLYLITKFLNVLIIVLLIVMGYLMGLVQGRFECRGTLQQIKVNPISQYDTSIK